MTETDSILEKAERYLRSADLLAKDGDFESSVSRTYYAMFYAAEAVLLAKNMSSSSHKGVIAAFGEHFVKTGIFPKEMGRELNRAFEKRQMGDYGHTLLLTKDEAEKMLQNGRKFVDKITKYFTKKNGKHTGDE